MNEEELDGELAAWFSHGREMDAGHAPPFSEVWTAVRARHERERRRDLALRVSAIAAMFVLLGVLGTVARSKSSLRNHVWNESDRLAVPWRTAVLASEWRAPTDFLLTAPDAGIGSLARVAELWNRDSTLRPNRIN